MLRRCETLALAGAARIGCSPADIDEHRKSGAWDKFTVDFFTLDGKTYELPFLEGSRASVKNIAVTADAILVEISER